MLEKLSEYEITNRDGSFINVDCNTKIINTLVRKINELVDAVNALVYENDKDSDWYDDPKHREQPVDPYAEQRKAFDVAVDALKSAHKYYQNCVIREKQPHEINWYCTAMNMDNDIFNALEQITALEQKD